MKKIYFLLSLCTLFTCLSCQEEDIINKTGYLRLEIGTNAFVNPQTKIIDEYNPKQIAVQIINASGTVVKETDDYTTWNNKQIKLAPGIYTVKAASNGFDGSESGFDIPYYIGSKEITIESGKENTATIICTLANVKVTVNFDQSFIESFKSAKATVSSKLDNVNPLDFLMGIANKSAYFPVGDLSATLSVVNKADKEFSKVHEITNVKARDHYILNYKVAASGSGSVNVSVDETEKTYTFTFNVSTEASTQLAVSSANAWSTFAYVEGEITSSKGALDSNKMMFEYKPKNAASWTTVNAIQQESSKFKATLEGLTPGTEYTYRMVYKGTEEYVSNNVFFTTETQNKIPNLSFDDWCKDGKHQYACTAADLQNNKFWDSGNEGANTLKEINPTKPEIEDVKSGKAARLASTTAASQFAAGSLFTGDFGGATLLPLGAKLNFGQPFTERPSQLTGWYKYNPGTIDYNKVSAVSKGDRDICSIYIALADWTAPFAVSTGEDKFVDFTDNSIIAYGELPADKTSPESMNAYEQFTIDIKYRDLERKPTYILIVCSASKYGDYFTGSTSSVLLLDEFDLIYGEPTIDPDYIK